MTYALFGDNSSQAEGIIPYFQQSAEGFTPYFQQSSEGIILKQLEKYHICAITYLIRKEVPLPAQIEYNEQKVVRQWKR